MIELFSCDARRQIRSIVSLCEEFGVRRTRAKFYTQNNFHISSKIAYDEIIFCAMLGGKSAA